MPELPEVETIKRELEEAVLGKKITEVCVHVPKVIRQPSVPLFIKGLEGVVIKKILRKAKVLVLELSNGKSLVIHLKMSGQLVYPGNGKHSRLSFRLSDSKYLDFNDQRLFGELRLLDDWHSFAFIKNLGPEPSEISQQELERLLIRKKTKIKVLLLDQSFISGIGNLYAAEILFRAKINPQRPANSLSDKEKKRLFGQMQDVLREAIEYGGSSVDDYVRLSGKKGAYVSQHKVYGRQGKPCYVCGAKIQRISLGARGTYFCPKCQPAQAEKQILDEKAA